MIKVFFYLNFKNTQYINQITTEYIVTNGKINIEFYNSKENKFIINKDKSKNQKFALRKLSTKYDFGLKIISETHSKLKMDILHIFLLGSEWKQKLRKILVLRLSNRPKTENLLYVNS